MNVLLTGISGLLGPYLAEELLRRGTLPKSVLGTYHDHAPAYTAIPSRRIDLADPARLAALNGPFDVVIHCAALTDVDFCESHPEEARRANEVATQNLVDAFPAARFVFISTEAVFHDKFLPTEQEEPNPRSVYGKTKAAAERIVLRHPRPLVLRTTIFGPSLNGQTKLYEWAYEGLRQRKGLRATGDNLFSPIACAAFARIACDLLERDASGLYHVASDEVLSRYAFVQLFAATFGLDASAVRPVPIAALGLAAPRSRLCALDATKMKSFLGLDRCSLAEQLVALRGVDA